MPICKKCKQDFNEAELTMGYCSSCLKEIQEIKYSEEDENIEDKKETPTIKETTPQQVQQETNAESQDDYGTSIAIAKLVSFIGWIAVIAGVGLTAMLVMEGDMALLGVPSAVTAALVGLILVIAGQSSRAIFDNANYSKHMLELMRAGR